MPRLVDVEEVPDDHVGFLDRLDLPIESLNPKDRADHQVAPEPDQHDAQRQERSQEPQDLEDRVQARGRYEETDHAEGKGEERNPRLERGERRPFLREEQLDLVQAEVDLRVLDDDLVHGGAAHPIPFGECCEEFLNVTRTAPVAWTNRTFARPPEARALSGPSPGGP